ncbi:putative transmembrane protein [Bacteroides coprosuis DSM 18011]|uniref:Putative transmembrane protein n=1 Tax=Bacteroides coprosuis DSM 18011 TaxID=679937 RepID=F3ZSY2_9BACE|nr:putative transmembrane protein [Bacteroides coprosuis DSM 18011]
MVNKIEDSKRLLSLDVLRGITVAGMILVNNTGSCGYNYTALRHASWDGLNFADLVFPMFMFMMGISTYISLRKYENNKKTAFYKIFKRTSLLIIIGLFMECIITWIEVGLNLSTLRLMGVMQRLGLCYGITALLSLYVPHKYLLKIALSVLLGYFIIQIVGSGFDKSAENVIGVVDRSVLGVNHIYLQGKQFVDPEGVLSTLPAIAQVMIGFFCGRKILEKREHKQQMLILYRLGSLFLFVGFVFSYVCPINKRLWSPTFVLVTSGVACMALSLLIDTLDIKQKKHWSRFFEVFGANPLILYVVASILAPLLKHFNVHQLLFNNILNPLFGAYLGSFMYGFSLLLILWIMGFILFKKRIYIKI